MRHDHRPLITRISVLAGLCLAACSSNNSGSGLTNGGSGNGTGASGNGTATGGSANGTGTGGAAGGTSTSGGTGGTTGSGGTGNTGAVAACQGLPFTGTPGSAGSAGANTSGGGAGGACTGVGVEAERIPMDLFFMMDRSISMGEAIPGGMTRWDALHAAVSSYVQGAANTDIGTGIGFFSQTGSSNDTIECNVSSYAQPDVGIGPLATTGPQILSAMAGITPGGLTPTVPALKGAIQYARQWSTSHPSRQTAVALVTDGFPTQCDNNPSSIAAAAADGFNGTPSIRTYVIGVGQVAHFNLEAFAQAGGTVQAYTVDDGDVTKTFVDTVANITSSKLACSYSIPPPSSTTAWIDYSHVSIIYTPAVGAPEEVPYLSSPTGCATSQYGGWYYDVDPAVGTPSTIQVCACTCSRFAAGNVEVRIGCVPRQGPQ